MELYFTGHCRSARGRLQSDMIFHQSRESCAMLVQRSLGMASEGKKERVRGLLRTVILHHTQVLGMKSPWKNRHTSNTPLDISAFPSLCCWFSLFPLSLYLCISFTLLLGISYKLPLSVSVMRSLTCSCFFCFFCPFFISWKSSVTASCVISAVAVVRFYLFTLLPFSPSAPSQLLPPLLAKLGAPPAWQRCHKRAVFIRLMEWVNNIAPTPPHHPAPARTRSGGTGSHHRACRLLLSLCRRSSCK